MVMTRLSTVMTTGLILDKRRTGSKQINVIETKDIEKYQKFMGGVDRGDQHQVMGAVLSNVTQFRKLSYTAAVFS